MEHQDVTDHLNTLRYLLAPHITYLPWPLVSRGALEVAARGWWLAEPAIGPRKRVARSLSERLYSARRGTTRSGLHETTVDQFSEAHLQVIEAGEKLELELNGSSFDAEVRKDPTSAVTELLQERIAEGEAGAVYRSFSAIAHGTVFGLMQFLAPAKERWQAEAVSELVLDPRIKAALGTASVGFIEFFDRLVTLMGWDEWAWAGWHDQLVEVVNRSLDAY